MPEPHRPDSIRGHGIIGTDYNLGKASDFEITRGCNTLIVKPSPDRTRSNTGGWFSLLWRPIHAFLMVVGVAWIAVSLSPLVCGTGASLLAGRWHSGEGQTLIVLGGSQIGEDFLGPDSYWRCVYAARLHRQWNYRRVIVSGGWAEQPSGEALAVRMKKFLIAYGVPAARIEVESGSSTTRENALMVKPMLEGETGQAILLTSDYHIYRARRAFAKAGANVVACSFPDAAKRAGAPLMRWGAFLDLSSEVVKIIYYRVRGWI